MISDDVPSLRLILLGGEALPPAARRTLVEARTPPLQHLRPDRGDGRRDRLRGAAGEPVTIGRPIPNYSCYVVDEDINLVAAGRPGRAPHRRPRRRAGLSAAPGSHGREIHRQPLPVRRLATRSSIAPATRSASTTQGASFSTAASTTRSRSAASASSSARSRQSSTTCRASRRRPSCCARTTGSTASSPSWCPRRASRSIATQSASALRRAAAGLYGPERTSRSSRRCRGFLRQGRPARRSRHAELARRPTAPSEQEAPANETEAALLAGGQARLPGDQSMPFDADFFTDLGGHSLLAARFVSAVRETPAFAAITLQDVYGSRSLRAMADAHR